MNVHSSCARHALSGVRVRDSGVRDSGVRNSDNGVRDNGVRDSDRTTTP
jgi:hypothetical protein